MKLPQIILSLLCSMVAAQAQIKVAIHDSETTAAGMLSRPDGVEVMTSSETWNNAVGQTVSEMNLTDVSGSVTTATLSYSAGFLKGNEIGWESESQDWVMMEAWVGFKSTESLTVSDLPDSYADGYSVVIYADSNDGSTRTMEYFLDNGSDVVSGEILDSGYFSGTFSSDKTVIITGLTGTSFTLTGNVSSKGLRSALCGFEIIPEEVTEIDSDCSDQAQIKVAIHDSETTAAGMLSQPDGVEVMTSSETWNNAVGQTVSEMNLTDVSGSVTTATLSYSAGFLKGNEIGWESESQDWVMMEAWVGFKSTESLTVSDLPSCYEDGYSIVIYADSNDGSTRTMEYFVDDGSDVTSGEILDSGYFSGTFSSDKTVLISGLTGTSFTLTGNASSSDSRSALCGFEIIPGVIPVIDSFSADDCYVQEGSEVELSWSVSNATALTLDPGGIDVTGQTWMNVSPSETTTYTLTATSDDYSVTADLDVYVGPERPNILLVLVDDYGVTDTSVPFVYDTFDDTGSPITTAFNEFFQTPTMETLAEQGMKFTQAYAMPMCSPTRATLMTGFNSPRHGITHHLNVNRVIDNNSFSVKTHRGPNNWRYNGMDTSDVTLPQLLGAVGYRTIHCGKWHLGSLSGESMYPTYVGFDVNIAGDNKGSPSSYTGNYGSNLVGMEDYEGSGMFLTEALGQAMSSEIDVAVDAGRPFFGYMSYYACHSPFTTNPDATGDYDAAYSTSHQKFATMVEGVDSSVGDIIDHLESLGVAEDTLIIFLGDNGSDSPALSDEGDVRGTDFDDFPIRGKKGSAYEGGTWVPLLVAWAKPDPDNSFQQDLPITGGSVEHDIVGVEDIAPTILAAADVTAPDMDGYDLSPYLRSDIGSHRPQKLLRHMPHEHRSDYFVWLREDEWKLLYRYDTDVFELYNLSDDRDETDDLAADQPEKVLTMARDMASELNDSWGVYGALWPTFNPTQESTPDRPLEDDPFLIDFSVDGRDAIDSDGDGLVDAVEDADGDGLVGASETSADNSDTDGDSTDDYTETLLNLDPLDSNSYFTARIASTGNGTLDLAWPSAPSLFFSVRSSTDLSLPVEDWTVLIPSVEADDTLTETIQSITIDSDQEKEFYSVELLP
jgi:arylsulfatase A-like enzyme